MGNQGEPIIFSLTTRACTWGRLAVLAPIMMALTAATPIVKGRLVATDVRWSLISQSVDDRTPAERGEATAAPDSRMAGGGIRRQTKSRYDSISCFWVK